MLESMLSVMNLGERLVKTRSIDCAESLLRISDMIEKNDISSVWAIIEKASIGMLTTQFAGGLRARPRETASACGFAMPSAR